MAMIDYGAVLKINGEIKNENEFFMDMQKAVGWVDYPRVRYEDCDFLDDMGCSNCGECPRRRMKHMSDPELGEWDATDGDCRGNKLWIDGKLDRNYFVYAGDEDFTVAVYKTSIVFASKNDPSRMRVWNLILGDAKKYWEPYTSRMARNIIIRVNDKPVHIRIKRLAESNSFYMRFWYKNNLYEVVYGYGIDPNKGVWGKVKTQYANKKIIKFVDHFWETRK